jgi:dihydroflavonol-4-reductase
MKAFITGATGLIGNQLVRLLIQHGYNITALVRSTSNLQHLPASGIDFHYGDILQPESLQCMKGCDIVFHAAGEFAYWGYNNEKFITEARQGMVNIIDAAVESGVKRIVFTSSSVTSGAVNEPRVLSENDPGTFEEIPIYIRAKMEQENIAFEKAAKTGMEVIAICPTLTVGGPDQHLTESNRMIVNYLKDPFKSTWIGGCNIVNVEDVACAMLLLAERGRPGEKYIAGSDNIHWKQLHELISELCGVPGPYLEAWHTSSYLLSAFQEILYPITKQRPSSTRQQAKMVGKYYWYSSKKLRALGYSPVSSERALISAISWLVTSPHIPASLRAELHLSEKVYSFRNKHPLV